MYVDTSFREEGLEDSDLPSSLENEQHQHRGWPGAIIRAEKEKENEGNPGFTYFPHRNSVKKYT